MYKHMTSTRGMDHPFEIRPEGHVCMCVCVYIHTHTYILVTGLVRCTTMQIIMQYKNLRLPTQHIQRNDLLFLHQIVIYCMDPLGNKRFFVLTIS